MRKLGKVNCCGIWYDVQERTAEEDSNLSTCYGYTVHGHCLIVISAGLNATCFRNTLLHEVQHGIWEHSGLRGLDNDDMSKFEETHIQIFTPHWITAMASIKKWRFK